MSLGWLTRWLPLLTGVVGAQLMVQGLNAISGLLIVHMLPRESAYAWFSVASSMIAVISLLSDSGTGVAANALGGPVWQERTKFSQVIAAVLRFRRWMVGAALLVALPWSVGLLVKIQAPWLVTLATVGVLGIAAWPMTLAPVYGSVNRLHSRYRPQLTADVISAIVRLVLTALFIAPAFIQFGRLHEGSVPVGYPSVPCFIGALIAATAPGFLYLHLVRGSAKTVLDDAAADSREFDGEIKATVWRMYPSTLYHCVSSQLSMWLLALFGSNASVADIGALGRLSVLVAVANAPVVQLLVPAFARCVERQQLWRQVVRAVSLYWLVGGAMIGLVCLLPDLVLKLLGPQYAHLSLELCWYFFSMVLGGFVALAWSLVNSRGWVKWMWLSIPITLGGQVAAGLYFRLDTPLSVIGFGIATTVPSLLLACWIAWRGFRRWELPDAIAIPDAKV